MNRREFMLAAAGTAMGGAFGEITNGTGRVVCPQTAARRIEDNVPNLAPRNRHPYSDVDWTTAQQVKGTTHMHCTTQEHLDAILKRGIEFLTISNYYPSAPWCPLSKMTKNYYRLHHDFPVVVHGKRKDGPFDWNKIVGEWIDELPEDVRAEYPFKEGDRIFKPLPEGMLEAPNAEHHNFIGENGRTIGALHMNAPGSTYASGTFDQWQKRRFQTGVRGGYAVGCGEFWKTSIDRMIAGLIYPDGGGVTINHPHWSALRRHRILDLLDYDPRVLGIEVIEGGHTCSEYYWDWVLATGRQCFGFFVPDHSVNRKDGDFGVNVLVVPERSVHACLKAYRQGNFYGARRGLGELKFTRIAFSGGDTVEAETDRPARIEVVTARGVVKRVKKGTAIKWKMEGPPLAGGSRSHANAFIRVKAYATDGSGEELFSQPYMIEDEPRKV